MKHNLALLTFVLAGSILLPTYTITLALALPYSVVQKVTKWYIAQGMKLKKN